MVSQTVFPLSVPSNGLSCGTTHLGVGVNVQTGLSNLQGRDVGDVLVLPFPLLLLQSERDSSDGSLLNSLHQVGGDYGSTAAARRRMPER